MENTNALEVMTQHLPLLDNLKNRQLAVSVANIWYDLWKTSKWENIEGAGWNPLCPGVTLVDHTRSVTKSALEFAKVRSEVYEEKIDFDVLLAGALLHDVSKLLEFEPGEHGGIKSKRGHFFQHAFLGAHKALVEGLPDEVVHIIISHTGQSRVIPQTPEAVIIYCIDLADADLSRLKSGAPLLMEKHK